MFISGGRIKVLGNGGFTLPRNIERAIENKFMKGDFIVRGDEVTEPSNMKSAEVVIKMRRHVLQKTALPVFQSA